MHLSLVIECGVKPTPHTSEVSDSCGFLTAMPGALCSRRTYHCSRKTYSFS